MNHRFTACAQAALQAMLFLAASAAQAQVQPQNQSPKQPAHTRADEGGSLAEVRVRDVGSQALAGGYAAGVRGSTAATRSEVPLIETPQSVQVISQQLLQDTGARQLGDVVDYVSAVTRQNDFGGTWDNYAIRGFSQTDGGSLLNGFASSRGYGPRRDAATIERVEFLKGPAAALYGSGEPGGTLNVVTKKPQFKPARHASLQAGTLGFARATLDATGPLSSTLAYRINAAAEDGASRSKLVDSRKTVFAPALSWTPGSDTLITFESELIRVRTPLDRGLVRIGGNALALPRDRYLGEPAQRVRQSGHTHQLTLDHGLNAHWRVRAGLSYRSTLLTGWATELMSLENDARTLRRRNRWRLLPARDTSAQAELHGKLHTGPIRHTLLAGLEAARLNTEMHLNDSSPARWPWAVDIHAPRYGQTPPPVAPNFAQRDRQRSLGLFMQDQIDLSERWKLLAGLRLDRVRQASIDQLRHTRQSQRHNTASPRIGLSYMLTPGSALYLNHSRSFRPNTGVNAQGHAFAPQHGRAWEAGLKWQSADQRLTASAALFNIDKTNVLTGDPNNPGFSIAAGKVRSRGLEADLAGQINPHWRLSANLALLDTEVTRDNNAALRGKRLAGIPRISGGLFAMYENALAGGMRYGLGGGITHTGERSGTATDTYRLPAYTLARISAYLQINPAMRLTLDVNNLFDKHHATASFGNLAVIPGPGRQITAGLQWRF